MKEVDVAYCGLLCNLCVSDGSCNCKVNSHCGKRNTSEGCFQYNCCTSKGIQGCWECEDSPCDKDMLAKGQIKMRAFVRCIKEDGFDCFSNHIESTQKQGLIYHRNGVKGDYDLETEDEVLQLLRNSK